MSTTRGAAECCDDLHSFDEYARPGDDVAFTMMCRLRLPSGGRVPAEVAVVYSKERSHEMAVIVIVPGKDTTPARVAHALPVTPDFTVSLMQVPPSPSTSFFAQSSKPYIEVTMGAKQKVELQFPPNSSLGVQTFLKAIRQAVKTPTGVAWAYPWLQFYPLATDIAAAEPGQKEEEDLERSFGDVEVRDEEANGVKVNEKNGGKKEEVEFKENGKKAENGKESNLGKPAQNGEAETTKPDENLFPNPFAPGFDKNDFIRKRLFQRQERWSSTKPVSIRFVTYNVNDRQPPTGTTELAPLLGYGADDIIVVGIQEADLRVNSILVAQDFNRGFMWESAIFSSLGDKAAEYEKVESVQFVGVLMIVLAKSTTRTDMYMVQQASRGIGLLGIGGNKAGVAVRLKVNDSPLCFVNCHLAAQRNQLERRRFDFQTLRSDLSFPVAMHTNPITEEYYPIDGLYGIEHADALFWLGDLNYRIELEDQEIRALVEAKDWATLFTADQLLTDIEDKQSFEGFSEPEIRFKPTFKYEHGSVTLDPRREPAYTDRVLYREIGTKIFPQKYETHDILWSDHLPVSSTFSVDTRVLDMTKRNEEIVAIQVELDKLCELYRPNIAVVDDEIDFGEVHYRRTVTRQVRLKNNGLVPATYSFRDPAPGKKICQPWFWPFPATGDIDSGKEAVFTVTCLVDEDSAGRLSLGDDMNDVLVLHVDNGKESFISLRATFVPTIAGLKLDLPAIKDKIRNLPLAKRRKLRNPQASSDWDEAEDDDAPKGKPPQEYWQLLEYLMEHGPKTENLWTTPVSEDSILEWIDLLDTAGTLPPKEPHVAAQTLLHLVYALPGNLVPQSERAACAKVTNRIEAYSAVEKISGVHANVLIGLMSVVRLCCGDEAPDVKMISALAWSIFGEAPAGREKFVRALLEL